MKSSTRPAVRRVSPCLLVESIENELEFLKAVFDVTVEEAREPRGTFWQVEAKLGETILKIGRAESQGASSGNMLYVWTNDLDGTYERAIKEGATHISEPTDQSWGGREAAFRDPQGQIWWIASGGQRLSNAEVEEKLSIQRRRRL